MKKKSMRFIVTECLGGGDGGDVEVEVLVTAEEIDQMKELVREEGGDEDYFPEYCPSLFEKIKAELQEDEDDGSDVYYKVQVPDSIYEAVEKEDE